MGSRLLFIYNPFSGKGTIKKYLSDIQKIFIEAGYEPVLYQTTGPKDATAKIIEAHSDYERIVVSGGDGTLKEACEGYIGAGCRIPLGYIPSGSTNDFGASLGLPKNLLEAAAISVGDNCVPIDTGNFNDELFVYIAAFGLFTDVAYKTNQSLKNFLGHAAYVLAAGKSVLEIPAFAMKAEIDDEVIEGQFIYGMISNSKNVGGMGFLIRGDVDLTDGLFEVMLVSYPNDPIQLADVLTYLTRMRKKTDLVHIYQAKRIKITCESEVSWTLDGEYGGNFHEIVITAATHSVNMVIGEKDLS